MATLTKKDLLEAIEDMPMDAPIVVFYGGIYEHIEDINVLDLYDARDLGKGLEKCICLYFNE